MHDNIRDREKNTGRGYFLVIMAALFFSCQTIFGKVMIRWGLGGLDVTCYQYCVAAFVMVMLSLLGKRKEIVTEARGNLKGLLLMGVLSVVTTSCVYLSLETVNAGIASMLLFTNPVFICLFFMLTGIRKIGIWNRMAVIAALLGSMLVLNVFGISSSEISLTGVLFGVASSVSYAAYNVFFDLKLSRLSTFTSVFYTQGVAALIIVAVRYRAFFYIADFTPEMILFIVAASVITCLLPVFFLFRGIAVIGSEKAGVVAVSELPITLIIAFLFLGETLERIQIAGIAVVVAAVLVLQKENQI